ncbi:CU044_5270 family protein [Streptomyces sp. S3(2020)]|uniref:CU044_5270 family protein n=1 Tax=Streptomyces sp. S3(2020) TaxID=2732044 RepID=UPI00148926F6|nr:CU044_5270 family protein [Streptomyces sp. S3(2020)]NNN30878.1 CU044_5270 family protein [Streptomyces sp. S3(2020)]
MNQLPEKDLPPGRHRLLREHLMTEIRQEEKKPVRRPWLRPALVAGAVAAVTAVTLTFAVLSSDGDSFVPPAAHPSTAVTQLLEDAALVAEHQDVPKVRDDQFTYIKSKEAWGVSERTCKVATAGPLQNREIWTSVDGRREGLLRSTGVGALPVHPDPDSGNFYRSWEKLPTDPDKMLAWLYEQNTGKEGYSDAYYAFKTATGLALESILPPEVGAALYRAVAKIPGVVLVKDSVDAAGRHGTAVGFVHGKGAYRQELIFNSKTWLPLGTRSVQLKDVKSKLDVGCDGVIKAGSVAAVTAVLERAIVDKKDQRP